MCSRYRYLATTVSGFVQQLAVAYITHGYLFYVPGVIPDEKFPARVDEKLLSLYDVRLSRSARHRRRLCGDATVQYLRYERSFVLVATAGSHPFFDLEKGSVRDFRRHAYRFRGYSISCRGGHAHVRIDRERYMALKADLLALALRDTGGHRLVHRLRTLPFDPFVPVKRQLFSLLRAINSARRSQGLREISAHALRLFRKTVPPFGERHQGLRHPHARHSADGTGTHNSPRMA